MRNDSALHSAFENLTQAVPCVGLLAVIAASSFGILTAASADDFYPAAHAHNDYLHKRPLLDALDAGFCSAEADIFLVNDELQVGHTRFELKKGRTLKSLYLQPLAERVAKHDGRVHKNGPTFTLLIDFKNKGEETYKVLREQLLEYKHLFAATKDDSGKSLPPAVKVVISGARPVDAIAADKQRLCGIDGRLTDLDSKQPIDLLPLISDNWRSHFKYRGKGELSPEDAAKLKDVISRVHAAGRKVCFWATPETKTMWTILADAGVDHINTDKLKELGEFLDARTNED